MEGQNYQSISWNIGRAGRAWSGDEAMQRRELTPEEFEMDQGKLFCGITGSCLWQGFARHLAVFAL